MHVSATRFGTLNINPDDIILFPSGLIGWETNHHWILLADADNDAIGWLQSTTDPDLALALISPRRFVPEYRVRVSRRELKAIELEELEQAYILNVVAQSEGRLTANLRAPLLFNMQQRLGRQVVTVDDQPLQWELTPSPLKLRKSA
jgi:flagellar assembly factor FliW